MFLTEQPKKMVSLMKSCSLLLLLSEKSSWCICWHVALYQVGNEKSFSMCMVASGFFQVPGCRVAELDAPWTGDTWKATATIRLSHYDVLVLWYQNYPYEMTSLLLTKIWWPTSCTGIHFLSLRKIWVTEYYVHAMWREQHCPRLTYLALSFPLCAILEVSRFADSPER